MTTNKEDEISALVPDYCNNRLRGKEKEAFEQRLLEDRDLVAECDDFRRLQSLYRQSDPVEPSPSDALFRQISVSVGHPKVAGVAAAPASPLLASIRAFWQRLKDSAAVPWLVAAAQTVVIVFLLLPAPQQDTYTTLSATAVPANTADISINVVFRPDAVEADIRSLLHAVQGSVRGGPSREGRYVVSVPGESDLAMAVRTLKEAEIVLFADPVR
jgi:anti-sigma-K factor RskA